MKRKIYYIMDTMCGWCYGFSDVMAKIQEKYKDKYDFEILPGGMWTGDNVKILDDSLGNYIQHHNKKIEQLTGRTFGEKFNENVLRTSGIVLDSFPGAKAVVLVQKLKKEVAFSYLKKIQEAFFIEGKDTNNLETYIEIAKNLGIDGEEFGREFISDDLIKETFKYFDRAASMEVGGFPSVILSVDDKSRIISRGYAGFEELDKILSNS